MKPMSFMLIAGEPSGDLLAAELAGALRRAAANDPRFPGLRFFGAGGPKMAQAGIDIAFDLTQHAVIGISDVLKNYFKFRRLFNQLLALAVERRPHALIGVDYGGFNLRFARAARAVVRDNPFSGWNPKIIQFVSPQVWASRPGRAALLAANHDLLLSIFPFEKEWYAQRAPSLPVVFVGHPLVERLAVSSTPRPEPRPDSPLILLLPGSRKSELLRHLPVILPALKLIRAGLPGAKAKIILPDESLASLAKSAAHDVEIQVGRLPEALAHADLAIASTGTVTMECAFFGVPALTLYKTSWLTYQIARRIVTVKSLTMPNLLAGAPVYPEFIQSDAAPERISQAALQLLRNESQRRQIKVQLRRVIASLGGPGAADRAARAILDLFR
ncbi:MAG: lipid-A-disaccharide synthase [Verrucomicrobia bacterium]|nr:lipid-A-disaccharide synthase [Verrucomicrobiota bacterium]MDE3098652.1 lipid-A-disaccharide synthase [Verrucomicrobiota bacterium]